MTGGGCKAPPERKGEDMRLQEIVNKTFEEHQLWCELEEDGLLPIQVNVLPECASYLGTDERHGTTLWRGVSGRMFELK